jgi:vacuolar-type H+-ATPase subunit I/STV1
MTPQQSADLKALHESIQLGTAGIEEEETENQRNDKHITDNTHTAETISSVQSQPASFSISTQTSTATATATTTTTNIEDTRPAVGTEEWHRRRRESHKLVERKRREAINEGINEIARIVPGCEKNKGSILTRAATYIRQLKDEQVSLMEKASLEKLLSEQAITHLKQQLATVKEQMEKLSQESQTLKNELESTRSENSYLKRRLEAIEAREDSRPPGPSVKKLKTEDDNDEEK